jgi:D-methionine transport system substrate-binding protein
MFMKSKIFKSCLMIITVLLSQACGNSVKNNSDRIKVGVMIGPEYEVAKAAQKVAKEKFALNVELIQFNDYIMPNTALHQKDIDANVFQNRPFLEEQSKQRGYKFVILGNTFVYPIAAYSRKIKKPEELKDGSTIVIPNDITNGGRSLLLLENAGLIKLKPGVGYTPRLVDIEDNPHNFHILELEAPQLTRALDDAKVSLAVINNSFAVKVGLFLTDGVIVEDKESPYVNLIVSREDNRNDERLKKFVESYQSDEVLAVAKKEFKDGAIKGW